MAEHTVVINVEASGEVTPAPASQQPDAVEATEEMECTDG